MVGSGSRPIHFSPVLVTWMVIVAMAAGIWGCLQIEGGSAEVSWVLRNSDEKAVSCKEAGIAKIRFVVLEGEGQDATDLCDTGQIGRCVFDCKDGHGTTPFRIPPGHYFFGLEAMDATGMPLSPDKVSLPAPVLRRVLENQVLDLGVWQIVLEKNQ